MNFGVVAGVRAYDDVCVGVFPVDLCRDSPVIIPLNEDIEERNFSFLFFFTSKFDSGVDVVETVVEVGCGVAAVVVVA